MITLTTTKQNAKQYTFEKWGLSARLSGSYQQALRVGIWSSETSFLVTRLATWSPRTLCLLSGWDLFLFACGKWWNLFSESLKLPQERVNLDKTLQRKRFQYIFKTIFLLDHLKKVFLKPSLNPIHYYNYHSISIKKST